MHSAIYYVLKYVFGVCFINKYIEWSGERNYSNCL